MRNFKSALVVVSLLSITNFAMAEGLYVVGGIGASMLSSSFKTTMDNEVVSTLGGKGVSSSVANGVAMAGGLGYSFNDTFAAEVGYLNSGTMSYTASATGLANLKADAKVTGMTISLLGSLPMSDKFSIYGKIGYSSTTTEATITADGGKSDPVSNKNSGALYGAGVKFKLAKDFSVLGGYDVFGSDVSGVSVGLQLNF